MAPVRQKLRHARDAYDRAQPSCTLFLLALLVLVTILPDR